MSTDRCMNTGLKADLSKEVQDLKQVHGDVVLFVLVIIVIIIIIYCCRHRREGYQSAYDTDEALGHSQLYSADEALRSKTNGHPDVKPELFI
ncbi:hypothetical protein EGR_08661 [Echinococcus granulosus]|uniref:Uncharacterized protein n=1 Tax=Echinococcus granulosus TaxID=6210 RepID=W6USW5_ECHGR|nr:hypothetical protein EGR_08661 [Echinococcus granulosus]EUB56484.1 hypothetical protein EGR_08661 [Echinococcus granulosus]